MRRRLSSLTLLSGHDVLWYATDTVGNLAALASNGIACIPSEALEESNKIALDDLDAYVEELPSSNMEPIFGPDLTAYQRKYPNPRNSLIALAGRGIYVFDAVSELRYKLLYVPKHPLSLEDLPEVHRSILSEFKINTDFSGSDSVVLDRP